MARLPINFDPTVTLHRAHDVRQLCVCAHCGNVGDKRHMVELEGRLIHGGCALAIGGVDTLIALPHKEQDKITLGEIGWEAMKAICDAR